MRFYLIEAIDQEGKKQKKVLSVTDESEIFPLLEFSGLIPLKIKKLPDYYRYLNIRKYIYRIKRQEIIEVLENLHLIVKSGLPINTGLMDLAEDAENPSLKEMLLIWHLKYRQVRHYLRQQKATGIFSQMLLYPFQDW